MTIHVQPPKQDRSRRTLARLVRAALDLIAERGVEATGVHDIVERADSSVGSFYARFKGKEDLLLYLEERLWSDAEARWTEAHAAAGLDELELGPLVEAAVRILLEAYRVGAKQRRVLDGRRGLPGGDEPARRFHRRLRRDLRELLLRHRQRIAHPDPSLAVDLGLIVVVGALGELDESGELVGAVAALDDEARVRELSRVYLSYLEGAPPSPGEGTEGVEFFEIWG